MISAMSNTSTSCSRSASFTPSLIMVLQNGHAAAMMEAPVSKASCVRSMFIRVFPDSSSLNICAPPAPQQLPFERHRFISTSSTSSASSTFLGAS